MLILVSSALNEPMGDMSRTGNQNVIAVEKNTIHRSSLFFKKCFTINVVTVASSLQEN